jgi:hypothetical protein
MKRSRAIFAALARGLAFALVLGSGLGLGAAVPAGAVLIASGDGTGNTSAPLDDPGFAHVGDRGGLTAVYIGDGWVLTANHVGTGSLTLGGVTHSVVAGSAIRLEHALGVPTDLKLFRLATDPGLPALEISASPPPMNGLVTLVGNGRDRGAPTTWSGIAGWSWLGSRSLRWGTNRVSERGEDVVLAGSTTRSLSFDFDSGAAAHEAVGATGDSGGAVFVGGAGDSELAGIIFAIYGYVGQPSATSLFGNGTFAADLSYYRAAILDVTSERACSDGTDDDGDGLVDYPADPGCLAAGDPFETNALVACDDGFDSDGDGLVDFPDDPGCRDPLWLAENPACSDGVDNDGDGKIDWNGGPGGGTPDPQCTSAWRNAENGCGLGFELVLLAPLFARLRRLRS